MKLLLIETGNAREDPFAQCWYAKDSKRFLVPLLALPVVAAMTPADFEIKIIDEKLRDIDFDEQCDLVCFSFKTKDAFRTYRYADRFRERGVPVILGGVHASLVPEEAAQHADAVVAGEAESVWPKVIEDFRAGNLQQIYRAGKGTALETAPVPRFDLLENDRYMVHAIQTSRGCLVGCEFCPIQEMFGGKSRNKPVERVMREIEAVRSIDPNKDIFFIDEMFCGGNRGYQKELLLELRREAVDFYCISDFKVINPQYIWDLASAGCRKLSINMPGTCLPQELKAVKAIQRLGIDVWGFFMFGFSFHTKDVFKKVVDFVRESGMKNLTITVMSPFPNTPMERRISARQGVITRDWALYDQCHVTCVPERMSAAELEEGFLWAWKELENHFELNERDLAGPSRLTRSIIRNIGALTLMFEKGVDKLLGRKDEPVDLLKIIGAPKAEVSITTHNSMSTEARPRNDK
ncbi:MAG: cobalamin-dependent protein [Deltaproteobacteria bacterium]|nr:cobalamin-dependent protein [Deltaproteobacteria bacterium]